MAKVRIKKQLTCMRCGYSWNPRIEIVRTCPGCRSPYWDVPRLRKAKEKVVKSNDKQGDHQKERKEGQELA